MDEMAETGEVSCPRCRWIYFSSQDRLMHECASLNEIYSPEKRESMASDDKQVGGTHYMTMPVQPWEVMEAVLTAEEFRGFLKGNIIKYAMRAGHKVGSHDDEAKVRHYKEKLLEVSGGGQW